MKENADMKIIVMDEARKKNMQICEILQRKKHTVVSCMNSASFLDALEESMPDRVVLNVETWQRGRAMFKYFDIPKKLGPVPIVFYNVPENFVNINLREKNEADRVIQNPAEPEAIAAAIE